MTVARNADAGLRWLNTFAAEALRQGVTTSPRTPEKKKKRDVPAPRYAHSR